MSHRDIFLFNTGGGDCPPCPAPEDGVYSGGVWQGPEPAAYQSWGWQNDLDSLDRFEISDVFGATHAQIWAALSVTAGGWLHYSPAAAIAAGADLYQGFKIFPKHKLWRKEGFNFAGVAKYDHWNVGGGNEMYKIGVEAVDSEGQPFVISGFTSSVIFEGYRSGRFYEHMDGLKSGGSISSTFRGQTVQINPYQLRVEGVALSQLPPFFYSSITSGMSGIYDYRTELNESYFWRPFVEIAGHGKLPFWTDSSCFIKEFKVLGFPKA